MPLLTFTLKIDKSPSVMPPTSDYWQRGLERAPAPRHESFDSGDIGGGSMRPNFFAKLTQPKPVAESSHQYDVGDIGGNAPVSTSSESKRSQLSAQRLGEEATQIPPSLASAIQAIVEGALKKMIPALLAAIQKGQALDSKSDLSADPGADRSADPAASSDPSPPETVAASSNPSPPETAAASSEPGPPPSSGPSSTAGPGSIASSSVGQWATQVDAASKASGVAPEVIGAQIWAESRGKQSTNTQNGDGTRDVGLMQIGQERWNRDIVPTLSATDKANIQKATGKDASQLDVTNPLDNVVAGAFHLKQYIDKNGGSLDGGLADYVGAGRDSKYVKNVHTFMNELANSQPLTQDSGG